jgi:cupin superfamily acireductone dioxygenase involved in methionine salvage
MHQWINLKLHEKNQQATVLLKFFLDEHSDNIEIHFVLAGHDIAGSNVDCPDNNESNSMTCKPNRARAIAKTMENQLSACSHVSETNH